MRTLIVGSGPTGLLLGAALARRGHQVTSVDRDPGPTGDAWIRRGVMQFEHAHGFRPQVPMTLQAEWPEAYTQLAEPGRPARGGAEPRRISPGAGGALTSIDLRASASPRGGEAARPHLAHRSRRRTRLRPRVRSSALGSTDPSSRLTSSWTPQAEPGALAGRARRAATRSSTATAASRTSTAPTGCRPGAEPGPDGEPDCLHGRLRRLPVPGLPARGRPLLGGARAPHRGRRTQGTAVRGRLRGGLPSHPGRSPSGPNRTVHSPPRRFSSAGRCATSTGDRPARPDWSPWGTRWRPRPRPAGAGSRWPACRSPHCSRFSTRAPTPPPWPNRSAPGATTPSNPGWPTTSRSTAAWSGAGRVKTST